MSNTLPGGYGISDYDLPPRRPLAAMLIALFGGLLILTEGTYYAAALSGASSVGGVVGAIAGDLAGLFALGAFFGLLVVVLSVVLLLKPELHTSLGIAVVVLALLSLLGGGGWILGLVLALVGGILAIAFRPDDQYASSGSPEPPGWRPVGAPPAATPVDRPSAPTSLFCSRCGAAMLGGPTCPSCGRGP